MEDILRFATDPKTLILKEILKIFESSNKLSFKEFWCKLPNISKKIGMVLFAYSITTHFEKITNIFIYILKFIFNTLVLKKYTFKKKDIEYRYFNSYFSHTKSINSSIESSFNNRKVQIHKRNQLITIKANKYLHSDLFEDIELFKKKLNTDISFFKKFDGNKLSLKQPMVLFDSENFLKLKKIVETFVYQSKNTEMISTLSIIINGEPGLGKTKFSEYICHKKSDITGDKIFDTVFLLDMIKSFDMSYDNMFNIAYFDVEISGPTLFVIDEIDKYLSSKLLEEYKKHKDECRLQKIKSDNFQDFEKIYKYNFLNTLLKILERSGEKYPIVVIFCCNNFSDIFSGVDMKHYKSLINRIVVQKFERCNSQETQKYLDYLNCKMNTNFDTKINFNVNITFRELFQITVLENYNIPNIISRIKNPRIVSFSLDNNKYEDDILVDHIEEKYEESINIDREEKYEEYVDKEEHGEFIEENIDDDLGSIKIDYEDPIYSEFCMYSIECRKTPKYIIEKTKNHIKLLVCKEHYNNYIIYGDKYLGYMKVSLCINQSCDEKNVLLNHKSLKCIVCQGERNIVDFDKSIMCCHHMLEHNDSEDFISDDDVSLCKINRKKNTCCLACKNLFSNSVHCYNCNYLQPNNIPFECEDYESQKGGLYSLNKELTYGITTFKPLIYLCERCSGETSTLEKNIDTNKYLKYFMYHYNLKKTINIIRRNISDEINKIKKSKICLELIKNLDDDKKRFYFGVKSKGLNNFLSTHS